MTRIRSFCRLGAAVPALLSTAMLTAPAAAQEDAPAVQKDGSGDGSRADAMAGDIVVTARKREERAQDIPIAISAFSGESIEARGIDKIDGVATFTPKASETAPRARRAAYRKKARITPTKAPPISPRVAKKVIPKPAARFLASL